MNNESNERICGNEGTIILGPLNIPTSNRETENGVMKECHETVSTVRSVHVQYMYMYMNYSKCKS